MKVLELFSGTHSVGKVCKELGYDVVSVDLEQHKGYDPPTHKVNILDFDYKQYDHFDIIWASPPCCNYSRLQNCNRNRMIRGELYTQEVQERNMKLSDELVKKTLEIIDYFKPTLWFMENPESSKLKEREIMKDLPYHVVSYCKYSDWGYQKHTRIWTNNNDFVPKKCNFDCDNLLVETKKHVAVISQETQKREAKKRHTLIIGKSLDILCRKRTTKLDRYRVPPKLIHELITSLKK
jgi:hypothetical protein